MSAPRGTIRAASLATSKRLQRVLAALRDAGADGLTTRDVMSRAHVCAVSACVDELRDPKNGFDITCTREHGSIYRYRLVSEPGGGQPCGTSSGAPGAGSGEQSPERAVTRPHDVAPSDGDTAGPASGTAGAAPSGEPALKAPRLPDSPNRVPQLVLWQPTD